MWVRSLRVAMLVTATALAAAACSASRDGETDPQDQTPEQSAGAAAAADFEIAGDTTWIELLSVVADAPEIDCIEGKLGDELPAELTDLPVIATDGSGLPTWPVITNELFGFEFGDDHWPHEMWACLHPSTTAGVFVALELHEFERQGYDLSRADRACAQQLVADASYGAGVARVMHRPQRFDDDTDADRLLAELHHAGRPGVVGCVSQSAEVVLGALVPRHFEAISFEELECMVQAAVNATREPDFDYAEFYRSLMVEDEHDIDDEAYAEMVEVVSAGADECLSADPLDSVDLTAGGFLSEEAEPAWAGQPADGYLPSEDEVDYFAFEATQGVLYEITVSPGTLDDPVLTIYDREGTWLDSNDDYGDSLAPRLFWEAPNSDLIYVEVSGFGTGTYTLMIDSRGTGGDEAGSDATADAGGGTPAPGEGVRITMGRANWSTGYFQSALYRLLLQELGYEVSDPAELELEPSSAYVEMAEGRMDFWANGWYPTHFHWLEPELSDGTQVGSHLTIVGEQMIAGGLQGFLVTASFADEFGVYTMDDLNADFRALAAFDATDPVPGNGKADIFGCSERWSCEQIIASQIAFSGWNNLSQVTADYDAMFARAVDAVDDDIPMVAYVWTPSAYFAHLSPGNNVYWMGVDEILDDSNPTGTEGGEAHSQRGHAGTGGYATIGSDQCPSAADHAHGLCPIGWIANDILVTANVRFLAANPPAAALLEAVRLSVFEVSQANVDQSAGAAPEDLAADWIADNRAKVNVWLSAARAADRRP